MSRKSGPGQSVGLLLETLPVLRAARVDYLIIGAFALAAYATVRATLDIEALLCAAPQQLKELAAQLRSAGFMVTLRTGDDSDPIPALLEVTDAHDNRVDFLGGLRGLDPDAFQRGKEFALSGQALRIVGLEDFIAMNCFAGSPQDLSDATAALGADQFRIDLDLVRRLTRRYGRDAASALEGLLITPP